MESKKILLADDDEVFLKLAERDLVASGYKVVIAKSGSEAIALAKTEKPDLMLLDIYMPNTDGAEAGSFFKNNSETKNIPVIYLTSLLTKKEESTLGHDIAGNFFIAKPYNLKELLVEIKKRI